jgi:hypothetical protein
MAAVSLDDYMRNQRARLEALKAETERERSILAAHASVVASPAATGRRSASPPPPPPPETGAGAAHDGSATTFHGASPIGHAAAHTSAVAGHDDPHRHAGRGAYLDQSYGEPHTQQPPSSVPQEAAKLRDEILSLDRQIESQRARVRDLQQHVALAERGDGDIDAIMGEIEVRRERLEQRIRDDSAASREEEQAVRVLAEETRERAHVLEQAKRKAEARAAEDEAGLRRMRDSVRDAEERGRGLESQIRARERTLELEERDVARLEAEFRDDELRAIDALRREVELLAAREAAAAVSSA